MRLTLPKSFNDMTLKEYVALSKAEGVIDRILALCPDQTPQTLRDAPASLISHANRHIERISQGGSTELQRIVTHNGVKYGFVPDWTDFTLGEYVDMDYASQDVMANVGKIMNVLYRPVTSMEVNSYTIESYDASRDTEHWMDLPAHVFVGAMLFFCSTRENSLSTMQRSLKEALEERLRTSGAGTFRFMPWLGRRIWGWKKQLRLLLNRRWLTLRT